MLLALAAPGAVADEGMWIPVLIEKYNIRLMQENGFKLTAEDIYSINRASMKDAVVLFGGGCTGEFISDKGLIITNHHCGYSYIQSHSTLEHDYLSDGFWAATAADELPNPRLTVTILKYMEDVMDASYPWDVAANDADCCGHCATEEAQSCGCVSVCDTCVCKANGDDKEVG